MQFHWSLKWVLSHFYRWAIQASFEWPWIFALFRVWTDFWSLNLLPYTGRLHVWSIILMKLFPIQKTSLSPFCLQSYRLIVLQSSFPTRWLWRVSAFRHLSQPIHTEFPPASYPDTLGQTDLSLHCAIPFFEHAQYSPWNSSFHIYIYPI